jgi:cytochrome b561
MSKPIYSAAASYFHWMVAIPLVGCVGTVLKAQDAPKEDKGKWMWRHKSLGLLTGMVVAPRLAYRVFSSKAVSFSSYLISLDLPGEYLLLTS